MGGLPDLGRESRPLAVVKLGGSVLTRKKEAEKLRPKVLARLAKEIAGVTTHRLVLLHGAGSFGHPGALRFGLNRPPSGEHPRTERARGAAVVSQEVRRLHLALLRELLRAGADPWSVPMANHVRQDAGQLVTIDLAPFSAALARGHLPVSFGDVVPDTSWGTSILSADRIAVALAGELHPRLVLFVSDVNGIYRPGSTGRPLPVGEVDDALVASLAPRPGAVDVTGEIRGKAEAMQAIAQLGVNAGLISGLSDGALSRALRGEGNDGSWARARVPGATD